MHGQRSAAAPALSITMPHPALPRRRSSMLSSVSDPHTPPPRNSPLPMLSPSANRKSSDSWNSSNYDAADDFEWEWKPEQTRLLSRVSPFRRVRLRDNPPSRWAAPLPFSKRLPRSCLSDPSIRHWTLFLPTSSPPTTAPFPLATSSIRSPEAY